jgi:hypothetical protein
MFDTLKIRNRFVPDFEVNPRFHAHLKGDEVVLSKTVLSKICTGPPQEGLGDERWNEWYAPTG